MFDDWHASLLSGVLCLSCFGGCALRGNTELLESQLRKQETALQQYARETGRLREELASSQREMDLLRAESRRGDPLSPQEESQRLARVSGIVFNSLLTAGQSQDEVAGDERFHAVFYPHDAEGEVVKLSGQVEIEALDLVRPSNQKVIGRWVYSPEQARGLWLTGFLTSGFQIDEAWESPPQGARVLLVARLTTTDGRSFETTHTIPVEPGASIAAAPRILPPPAQASAVEPASFEAPAQMKRVPEPEEWQFEIRPAPRSPASPRKTAFDVASDPRPLVQPSGTAAEMPIEKSAAQPAQPANEARPFPESTNSLRPASGSGLKTSDRWTDETLPVVR